MLKPQKKLSKKEIKEDKFVQTAMQAKSYMEDNYRQVLTVTLVIFGIILAIMVYIYFQKQTAEKSNTILGKAQLEYQNLNYTKARTFLNQLLSEYSGTEAAAQGMFLMANLHFQDSEHAEAKRLYEEFIDDYSGSKILLASGYAGLAACLVEENNFEEAAEKYKRAHRTAPEFVEAPNYLYLAGLNYLKSNNQTEAEKLFKKIQDDYPDSQRAIDAKTQLIALNYQG